MEEVELFDVSPVTFPAYPDTDVQVRSIFGNFGIDYNDMQKVLIRSEHNLEISEEDKEIIINIMDRLNDILLEQTLGDDDQDDQDMQTQSVEILRRKLELKLKSSGGNLK